LSLAESSAVDSLENQITSLGQGGRQAKKGRRDQRATEAHGNSISKDGTRGLSHIQWLQALLG